MKLVSLYLISTANWVYDNRYKRHKERNKITAIGTKKRMREYEKGKHWDIRRNEKYQE